MGFLTRILFYIKRPKVIIVTGKAKEIATEAIYQVLKSHFKVKKKTRVPGFLDLFGEKSFIVKTDLNTLDKKDLKGLIKATSLSVLVITHIGEIPPGSDFFTGDRKETKKARKLAKEFPTEGFMLLNYDDESAREIGDKSNANILTFGLEKEADFYITDVKINKGTNFKINYKGNTVPVWQGKTFGKEQVYTATVAVGCGVIFGLNFVQISKGLPNYNSLPGKMRLVEGIKNSKVLDDSKSASVFSMSEALEILGRIEGGENFQVNRKIAVVGDVLGVGKYTIEAHEAIGERAEKNSDILFTVGSRAKFVGQGALNNGMKKDRILSFNTIESLLPRLKQEIKENDLILVDGSREMEMGRIVEEIKS